MYVLTLTSLGAMLFEPVIMLFISINESTFKYILLAESIQLFFMYVNVFFNLSKLIKN